MFSDVVMGIDKENFDKILDKVKADNGVELDSDLSAENLKEIVALYKDMYKEIKGEDFLRTPKTS